MENKSDKKIGCCMCHPGDYVVNPGELIPLCEFHHEQSMSPSPHKELEGWEKKIREGWKDEISLWFQHWINLHVNGKLTKEKMEKYIADFWITHISSLLTEQREQIKREVEKLKKVRAKSPEEENNFEYNSGFNAGIDVVLASLTNHNI